MKMVMPVSLGAVHTHTHTHTYSLLKNKKNSFRNHVNKHGF